MNYLGRALLILVAIAVVVAVVWVLLGRAGVTADLASITSDVQHWDARASQEEAVPAGERRKLHPDDGVTVDNSGRARLSVEQCLWEIFRDTGLKVEQLPSASAGACVVQLSHGTIYNQVKTKTVVNTDWAVVTAVSTRFLVHLDAAQGLLWVIVEEGIVEVEARGQVVRLGAGEQTWVFRGEPPEPARPARRSEVGGLFPTVDILTNGELSDEDVLLAGQEVPDIEPPGLVLKQSTDDVLAGDCTGPHTVQIVANLTGEDAAVANAIRAVIRYRWEGSQQMSAAMERVDDRTFVVEIGPFDYCCLEAGAEYVVQVSDASGRVLVSRPGKFIITFCRG